MANRLYVVDAYKGYLTSVEKDYAGYAMCADMGKLFTTYQGAYNFLNKYKRHNRHGYGEVISLKKEDFREWAWENMESRAISPNRRYY